MEKPKNIVDRIVTIPVDVTNDFCTGGALPVPDGERVIPPLNRLFAYTRINNGLVVATKETHPLSTPHFDKWPIHGVEGTWGAQFHPDLDDKAIDIVVNKGMGQTDGYSGFEGVSDDGETLESLVTPISRERVAVLIGGLATDYCVLNTALDALKIAEKVRQSRIGHISVYAIYDAMRAVNINPDDGKKALTAMEEAGAIIVDSDDVINGKVLEIKGGK
jgi:nicotinamidase/pyrazinamidase